MRLRCIRSPQFFKFLYMSMNGDQMALAPFSQAELEILDDDAGIIEEPEMEKLPANPVVEPSRIDTSHLLEDMEACSDVIAGVLQKVAGLYGRDSGTEWAWSRARDNARNLRLSANLIKSGQLSNEDRETPHAYFQADELRFGRDRDRGVPPVNHSEPINGNQLRDVRNFAQYLRLPEGSDIEKALIAEIARKARMILKPGAGGHHQGGFFDRQAVQFSWIQENVFSPKGEKGKRPYNITVATLEEIAMVKSTRAGSGKIRL